jgi:hypothetical protein
MNNTDELVALFQSMDREAQEYVLETARRQAKRCPAKRAKLRLVTGQLGGRPLGTNLSGIEDVNLPFVSSAPV